MFAGGVDCFLGIEGGVVTVVAKEGVPLLVEEFADVEGRISEASGGGEVTLGAAHSVVELSPRWMILVRFVMVVDGVEVGGRILAGNAYRSLVGREKTGGDGWDDELVIRLMEVSPPSTAVLVGFRVAAFLILSYPSLLLCYCCFGWVLSESRLARHTGGGDGSRFGVAREETGDGEGEKYAAEGSGKQGSGDRDSARDKRGEEDTENGEQAFGKTSPLVERSRELG